MKSNRYLKWDKDLEVGSVEWDSMFINIVSEVAAEFGVYLSDEDIDYENKVVDLESIPEEVAGPLSIRLEYVLGRIANIEREVG